MKPRKKPVKIPSSLIASRKVRKVMPPPTKVHKKRWKTLDETVLDQAVPGAAHFLGDPFDSDEFDYENDPFKDNWLYT